MLDAAIAIVTYQGPERETAYSDATIRVRTLLQSIAITQDVHPPITVCHDGPCRDARLPYISNLFQAHFSESEKWKGVSGNFNHAMEVTDPHEFVIILQDDQIVLNDWLRPMLYFIEHNDLPIDAWSFSGVYVPEEERKNFYLTSFKEWYRRAPELLKESLLTQRVDLGKGRHPEIIGNPWGSAMVVKRSVWKEMGGFWEDIFQPDEQYGVYVYRNTPNACVWVPTGLCINLSNGSTWPDPEPDCYTQSRRNWEKYIGDTFDNRGKWWLERAPQLQDVREKLMKSDFLKPGGW